MDIQLACTVGELKRIIREAIVHYGDNDYNTIKIIIKQSAVELQLTDAYNSDNDPHNPDVAGKD